MYGRGGIAMSVINTYNSYNVKILYDEEISKCIISVVVKTPTLCET